MESTRSVTPKPELREELRCFISATGKDSDSSGTSEHELFDPAGVVEHELFEKELTQSDIGHLNRIIIPKKEALKHFPTVVDAQGTMLDFVDRDGGRWTFKYCYWKSCKSYAIQSGWINFVKAKKLKLKDVVIFYTCEDPEGHKKRYRMIDVRYYVDGVQGDSVVLNNNVETGVEIEEGEITETTAKKGAWLFGEKIG